MLDIFETFGLDKPHPAGEKVLHNAFLDGAGLVHARLQHSDVISFSEAMDHPEMLSFRKRIILSWFAVRLENCFSQTSLKRANTLRLMDS